MCGDDKEYVFPYTRKSGKVKGHCRNLHAPRPNARKAKPDPREKQLAKLVRQRDSTNDMAKVAKLSAEIRALRAELKPPEPPTTPTPSTDDPPPVPDTIDDTEAPATVPPPDDTDDSFVSPFTGEPGTGFDVTVMFNDRVEEAKVNRRSETKF